MLFNLPVAADGKEEEAGEEETNDGTCTNLPATDFSFSPCCCWCSCSCIKCTLVAASIASFTSSSSVGPFTFTMVDSEAIAISANDVPCAIDTGPIGAREEDADAIALPMVDDADAAMLPVAPVPGADA